MEAPGNVGGSQRKRAPIRGNSLGADGSNLGARRMAPTSGMQTGSTYILALEAPRNDDGSTSRAGRRDPIRGANPGADASTVGARRMAPISGLDRTGCFPDVVTINAGEGPFDNNMEKENKGT